MWLNHILNLRILLRDSGVPRNKILLYTFRSGGSEMGDYCCLFICWLVVALEEAFCLSLWVGDSLVVNVNSLIVNCL